MKAFLSINVAYNNEPGWFKVVSNSMFEWNDYWGLINDNTYIPYTYEILEIFFKTKNVIVNWINCNYTWGWYDDETERWTGAVGKVKMNTFLLNKTH